MISPGTTCPSCGVPLISGSAGRLCPACLLGEAMEMLETLPDAPPTGPRDTDPLDEAPASDPMEGATLGPNSRYRILQRLGEGGFGTVYMAQQDEPVRRRVALKVLKAGMDARQVVARFEAERQALAMMDHPNIAKVFDGGETEQGRPFFVMELVRGTPITAFCDREKLDTRARLQLFLQVCGALQHAHQKGIIHRDLKPANVLVTVQDGVEPVPKVIDFGVAKAIDGPLTDKTLFTRFEQMIGTPVYMSPEQAGADAVANDIDTRADIYALGVLLYELLTGTTPFEAGTLQRAAFDEVRRILREEEAHRPSVRLSSLAGDRRTTIAANRGTEASALGKLLRGDLDWIVMKAIEKDRRRRYETANALARDVELHLANEPVSAGPPTFAYRIRKLLQKHRIATGVAATVVLSLLSGVVVAIFGLKAARDEARNARESESRAWAAEQRADLEATRLRELNDSLVGDIFYQMDAMSQFWFNRSLARFRQVLKSQSETAEGIDVLSRAVSQASGKGLSSDARSMRLLRRLATVCLCCDRPRDTIALLKPAIARLGQPTGVDAPAKELDLWAWPDKPAIFVLLVEAEYTVQGLDAARRLAMELQGPATADAASAQMNLTASGILARAVIETGNRAARRRDFGEAKRHFEIALGQGMNTLNRLDLIRYTTILLELDEMAEYEEFCGFLIENYRGSNDFAELDCGAKMAMLVPREPSDPHVKTALSMATSGLALSRRFNPVAPYWELMTLGMAQYRSGAFSDSIKSFESALKVHDDENCAATTMAFQAMALAALGASKEAHSLLANAERIPSFGTVGDDLGYYWHDILNAERAIIEARKKLLN